MNHLNNFAVVALVFLFIGIGVLVARGFGFDQFSIPKGGTFEAKASNGGSNITVSYVIPDGCEIKGEDNLSARREIYYNKGKIGEVYVFYNKDTKYTVEKFAEEFIEKEETIPLNIIGYKKYKSGDWYRVAGLNDNYDIFSLGDWLAIVKVRIKGIQYEGISTSIEENFSIK